MSGLYRACLAKVALLFTTRLVGHMRQCTDRPLRRKSGGASEGKIWILREEFANDLFWSFVLILPVVTSHSDCIRFAVPGLLRLLVGLVLRTLVKLATSAIPAKATLSAAAATPTTVW